MTDRAACFDVPMHHSRLWRDFADTTPVADAIGARGEVKAVGFDHFMGETFHRLYSESPAEIPADARSRAAAVRAKLHTLASDCPEFETLRKTTVRDARWAGMAATTLAEHVASAMPARMSSADADKAREILASLASIAETMPSEALAEHVARAEGTAIGAEYVTAEQAAAVDESAIRTAIREGVEAAQQSIEHAKGALAALGWGEGAGTSQTSRDPGVAIELARRVASSETLRSIIALAGRLTLTARAKRASRTDYARSETTGVEPTSDLDRLLPSEMVALSDPLMTADLFRKLVEGAAMGYKVAGKEKEGKGPIVVIIDQSGSMKREHRDVWAKAIALALLDTARAERRAFGIVLYDDGVRGSRLFPKPEDASPVDILDLLSIEPDGGTEYAPAFEAGLAWVERPGDFGAAQTFKRADIVHLTDGSASTDAAAVIRERAAKVGCHIYGIQVGMPTVSRALAAWSDETAVIADVKADAPAVDLIFDSI